MLWLVAFGLLAITFGFVYVYTRKVAAIRARKWELDIFFGTIKLILWEPNEGLVLLKNKQVTALIYGPKDGGGIRFIYPVFGDEVKVRVPLHCD
jgi:hypothetical protein